MKQGSFQVRAGRIEKQFAQLLRRGVSARVVPEVMSRRAGVFTKQPALKRLIGNRLGWVDGASNMKRKIAGIEAFGQKALADGVRHVVLMGMGGSSLCPELFKLVFKKHPKLKSFDVVDSTDPDAVRAVAGKLEWKRSLFIVASKSGGTVETRSQEAYFTGRLREAGIKTVGKHFVAITDEGSSLQAFARRNRYRKVFVNPSDIGGRYSALSYFGLVPAFFAGVDLKSLVDDAVMMERLLRERDDETNPALVLAALMAAGAKAGINKLTFVSSKRCAPLVPWVEQLVAESTGKKGKGVVPIENESLGAIEKYGQDRLFVLLRMANEAEPVSPGFRRQLLSKKYPVIEITLGSKFELGRQFLLWEAATAAVGYYLGVNPFDEPNVTESKDNTKRLLAGYEKIGKMPEHKLITKLGRLQVIALGGPKRYTRAELGDLRKLVKRFFAGAKSPSYFALLNYFRADTRTEAVLAGMRTLVRDKKKLATLRGYGPRYLHSIGQLYKGGPKAGYFVVFVRNNYSRAEIPGQAFDFDQLIHAQAVGDAQALIKRKLPTLVVAIDGKPSDGLEEFARVLRAALK